MGFDNIVLDALNFVLEVVLKLVSQDDPKVVLDIVLDIILEVILDFFLDVVKTQRNSTQL